MAASVLRSDGNDPSPTPIMPIDGDSSTVIESSGDGRSTRAR
jgi:hypothetical protein